MSATLAAEPIAQFLHAPILRAEGRLYDVAIEHLPQPDDRPLALQVASAVRRLAREEASGDVLVFLPGAAEIQRAEEACASIAEEHGLLLVRLHGDLPPDAQDRAVRPESRRKVILSTNVAESSVTIEGVRAVVDSGLARVASYAPWSGLARLRVEKVSRASAVQRAGRAGRTGPGRCLRLYTKADLDARPPFELPEILRADLSQTTLELSAAGIEGVAWFEPPPEAQLRAARELLGALGATGEDGRVTALGRRMARFGIHPRQARILAEGEDRGVPEECAMVAALLAERDIRLSSRTRFSPGSRAHAGATERSDVVAMLDVFREAKDQRFAAHALRAIGLDPGAVFAVDRASKDLARRARSKGSRGPAEDGASAAPPRPGPHQEEMELEKCILAGYPDRVASRLRPGARALAIAGARTGELSESSAVRDALWMVAVDAEDVPRKTGVVVRLASAIEPDWLIDLFPGAVKETHAVEWDAQRSRVRAVERLEFGGLTLHENESDSAAPEDAAKVLATAALAAGPRAFVAEDALESMALAGPLRGHRRLQDPRAQRRRRARGARGAVRGAAELRRAQGGGSPSRLVRAPGPQRRRGPPPRTRARVPRRRPDGGGQLRRGKASVGRVVPPGLLRHEGHAEGRRRQGAPRRAPLGAEPPRRPGDQRPRGVLVAALPGHPQGADAEVSEALLARRPDGGRAAVSERGSLSAHARLPEAVGRGDQLVQVPGSNAECPASGTTRRSASGHARWSAQALSIGHTTS